MATSIVQATALPFTVLAADDSVPTVPVSGDKFDQLAAMMMDATKTPAEQVTNGRIPASTIVSIKPENQYLKEDMTKGYNALVGMQALAQLYTAMLDITNRTKRGHSEPYKITDEGEAMQAYADQADFAYQAMTQPLAGFYILSTAATESFKQQMTRADFHAGFLGEIFKGFQLSDGAVKSLDTVLTNFAQAVGKVEISDESEEHTINHTLKVNTVPPVNISGDDENPVFVYQPTTTLVYMKIQAKAWKSAISKWSGGGSVEHFEFSMYWTSVNCQLDMDTYNASKSKFDKIIEYCTGKNLEAFGADLNHDVVDTNQNK